MREVNGFLNIWAQPLEPIHPIALSALAAAVPLVLLLVLMGGLRKSGSVSAAWGLGSAFLLAVLIWGMPVRLALSSAAYGCVYGLLPIMWIVFTALWLYNLSVDTGNFELLRRWMAEHASGDMRIQAVLVAFCFGALLEGTAGFGTPVAVAAYLLLGLGFSARQAVTVSLIANTAPVAFGALGIPIVALAGVTGLDKGLRETWPAALASGATFALVQFLVSNFSGPYAADILAALASTVALVLFLRVWRPRGTKLGISSSGRFSGDPVVEQSEDVQSKKGTPERKGLSRSGALAAWAPWILLSVVMVVWSYFKFFQVAQISVPVPGLHNKIFITLYQKPYPAIYLFQPLAAGTAALCATLLTALTFASPPKSVLSSGLKTLRQLLMPGLTVGLIVALAYLYNYSGMAYTLGAALAKLGHFFPLASGFLGWMACFLSGSDTASNLLFGNLQVAASHQIGVSPVLLAATNSSGAVTGKMISPQNIAVGVTTVGLIGQEGNVLRSTFWHSILLAAGLSLLAFAQAYWVNWMVP
ncbi:MAG: lactate permease [Acidobacteria bacterium]|nr:MAG: lactate permease [Acidobacteriota bacterium]